MFLEKENKKLRLVSAT